MFLLFKRHLQLGQREKERKAALAEKNRRYLKQGQAFVNHWNAVAQTNASRQAEYEKTYGKVHTAFLAAMRLQARKKRIGTLFADLEYATLRVHLNKDANNETFKHDRQQHENKKDTEQTK